MYDFGPYSALPSDVIDSETESIRVDSYQSTLIRPARYPGYTAFFLETDPQNSAVQLSNKLLIHGYVNSSSENEIVRKIFLSTKVDT